jgi:single-strand DNA-binding protein
MKKNSVILNGTVVKPVVRKEADKEVCYFSLAQEDANFSVMSEDRKIKDIKDGQSLIIFGILTTKEFKTGSGVVSVPVVKTTDVVLPGESLNRVFLAGRFTKDSGYYPAKDGKKGFLRNTVATESADYADKEATEFIGCNFYEKTAEFVHKYFGKGSAIWAEGRASLETYEKDGKKYTSWRVNAFRADFLENKKKASQTEGADAEVLPTADGCIPSGWGNLPV